MLDHESYEALRPEIEVLDDKRVRPPDLPVDLVLNEAGIMVTAARYAFSAYCFNPAEHCIFFMAFCLHRKIISQKHRRKISHYLKRWLVNKEAQTG